MNRIFIPATSVEDWQRLLASPERHWRTGYSARTLASSWQTAQGFPAEIKRMFAETPNSAFHAPELLFAFPEYKVKLPAQGAASQSDIFAIAKTADAQLLTMTVEGKVNEPFDRTVGQWLADASAGKQQWLDFLTQRLGITNHPIEHIRYQLLHRTVAAILEAERLNAKYAVSLIHSFSQTDQWFDDYEAFVALFGKQAQLGKLIELRQLPNTTLYCGWVRGNAAYLTS